MFNLAGWLLAAVCIIVWLGFAITGFKGEKMDVHELKKVWLEGKKSADSILVDVRETGEFQNGHVPGAVNIPLTEVQNKRARLDPYSTIYVICLSGGRSASACQILFGFFGDQKKLINVVGGTSVWILAGYPLDK